MLEKALEMGPLGAMRGKVKDNRREEALERWVSFPSLSSLASLPTSQSIPWLLRKRTCGHTPVLTPRSDAKPT